MKINSGKYVDFNSDDFSKKNNKKSTFSCDETKKVKASSMDALSASGRAFVNMSFKGKVSDKPSYEFKELTDEEFEELREKIEEKLKNLPENMQKEIGGLKFTKKI